MTNDPPLTAARLAIETHLRIVDLLPNLVADIVLAIGDDVVAPAVAGLWDRATAATIPAAAVPEDIAGVAFHAVAVVFDTNHGDAVIL